MLLEIFFFFTVVLRVLDLLYLHLSVNEIVNSNQICSFILKDFLHYLISFLPY